MFTLQLSDNLVYNIRVNASLKAHIHDHFDVFYVRNNGFLADFALKMFQITVGFSMEGNVVGKNIELIQFIACVFWLYPYMWNAGRAYP